MSKIIYILLFLILMSCTQSLEKRLIKAVLDNNLTLVNELIIEGANVNYKTSNGSTSLLFACSKDNFEIVKLLLKNGAQVNIQTINGDTPLMSACSKGNTEIVKILLSNNANVNLKYIPIREIMAHTKRSPLSVAANEEIKKILIEKGALE